MIARSECISAKLHNIHSWRFGVLAVALAVLNIPALCQSSALWSGSAQCTVTEQDQAYQRQEVQTWALTGAAPSQQGAMQIYPATWTDTGAGQLVRAQGAQTNNTVWQTNAQGAASIAFFVRASDQRLIIGARHARQSAYGGISATRQISVNGVAQSPTPFNQTVFEWMFPRIEADPNATVVDGSTQSPTENLPADLLHRFGGQAPNAVCQWHFAKGGVGSANPAGSMGMQGSNQQNPTSGNAGNSNGQNCETPATVQQSFETMKAQLKAQYDQLIRGASDASEVAALTNQEQKMLASLNNQEQRDMALASQGCMPPASSGGSTSQPPSGSQNPGAPSNGGQGTQNPTNSGSQAAGVSLTTASSGNGSGVVAMTPTGTPCGANCAQYTPGTAVTVIAVPSNGSSFTGFSGGGCTAVNPCSFTITTPTIVAAAFSLNTQTTTSTGTTGATPSGTTPQTGTTSTGSGSTSNTTSTMTRPPVTGVNVKPTTGVVKTAGATSSTSSSTGSSTPPPPSSATYRVTITGLLCTRAITENGDAVYAAAVVRQYDRHSGQSTMLTNVNTWTYGNVNGMQDQRKQAGSRSPMGGIGIGDMIPTGFVPGVHVTLPPQPNVFPMGLWEGTLTDGIDAVVISPSVWIVYGDRSLFSTWNQNEDSLTNSIYLDSAVQSQISNQTLGNVNDGTSTNAPGGTANNAASTAYFASGEPMIITTGIIVQLLSHPGTDRPLGLIDASTSSVVLPNATLVLTREIIEKSLGTRSWTTTAIDLKDTAKSLQNSYPGSDRAGEYTMFIQIERTSGSGNPVASAAPAPGSNPAMNSPSAATPPAPNANSIDLTFTPPGFVTGKLSGPSSLGVGASGTFQLAFAVPPAQQSTTISNQPSTQTTATQTTAVQTRTDTTTVFQIDTANLTFQRTLGDIGPGLSGTAVIQSGSLPFSAMLNFPESGAHRLAVYGPVSAEQRTSLTTTVTTTVTTLDGSCNCKRTSTSIVTQPPQVKVVPSTYQLAGALWVAVQ